MKPVEIDGSFGEGGGQILRTSLSLSCIRGQPFRLFNIRKNRKKPGLMPQHITCVNALSEISSASVNGNEIGSTELFFAPEKVRGGDFTFDIKTAGSISLVFQTLLPSLIFADRPSHISIRGGTHVPFSPAYHFISGVFLPMLNTIGIECSSFINRYGFYPRGGGDVRFTIHPVKKIHPVNLILRGKLMSLHGYSAVSRLPLSIAERQKQSLIKTLDPLIPDIQVFDAPSDSAGTFVFLKSEYENTLAGFTSLGEKGKLAESVGEEAALRFRDFHHSKACLDPHLSDQIVLYLSLSGEASSFTTSLISKHLQTNLWVIKKFMNTDYLIEGDINLEGRISIRP